MEKIVEFTNVAKLKSVSDIYSQIDDSYVFCHVTPGSGGLKGLVESTPLKLGGSLILLMRSGSPVDVEINQERYTVTPGCIMLAFPGYVVQTLGKMPDDTEIFALFSDVKFSQQININLNSIATPPMLEKPKPVQRLSKDEADLLFRYFELLHLNTDGKPATQINKLIATSIMAAMVYQMVEFYHRRMEQGSDALEPSATATAANNRRRDYVRNFIRLVHLNYTRERSVAFYADKLFVSPKYLSLMVKEATGRSAAKWIDEFVLMEAKNMLRFSGKNIQQVAYALNFPTQSSFGKYFKHLTGMSPTEYQKS